MSAFISKLSVRRFRVAPAGEHGPPPKLWESGNPAPWAGFPSAEENLPLVFLAAAFPQLLPRRTAAQIAPRTAARTTHSRCPRDTRRQLLGSRPAFRASVPARSAARDCRTARCYRG